MDEATHQIIVQEVLEIATGLICNHLSAASGFVNNTTITSSYILTSLFSKLNRKKFNICSPEIITIIVAIASHITQVLLAYQRNQEDRWNEPIPLTEISCNFLATAAPAVITYFQHYRTSRNQPRNNAQMTNSINPIYHEDDTLDPHNVQIASSSPAPSG